MVDETLPTKLIHRVCALGGKMGWQVIKIKIYRLQAVKKKDGLEPVMVSRLFIILNFKQRSGPKGDDVL